MKKKIIQKNKKDEKTLAGILKKLEIPKRKRGEKSLSEILRDVRYGK